MMDEMGPELPYCGVGLDRVASRRKDETFVGAQLADRRARVLPMRGELSFVGADGAPDAYAPPLSATVLTALRDAGVEPVLLGLDGDVPYLCADVATLDDAASAQLFGAGTYRNLREVRLQVGARVAARMAYARALLHWHRTHGFCNACGAPTSAREGGHQRVCANGHQHYPRISPAVIMLVAAAPDGEPPRCVLARHGGLPPGMYSTLAGFVEPGESLEEAVAREVAEEVGLVVDAVAYRASQPWPFPASLMIGFQARATARPLQVDPDELDDARWFSADELRAFGDVDDPAATFRLPRRDSVARYLIERWLQHVG